MNDTNPNFPGKPQGETIINPVESNAKGRDVAARISDRTGKPVRSYKKSGEFSKKTPGDAGRKVASNFTTPVEENSHSEIPDADKELYEKCFGESVEAGLRAVGEFAAANVHHRLRKIGTNESTCREIAGKMELPAATGRALNSQATLLAKKYELLSRFGVEATFVIGLATWGASIASALKAVKELEEEVKKVNADIEKPA